jgi:hypothetical protein
MTDLSTVTVRPSMTAAADADYLYQSWATLDAKNAQLEYTLENQLTVLNTQTDNLKKLNLFTDYQQQMQALIPIGSADTLSLPNGLTEPAKGQYINLLNKANAIGVGTIANPITKGDFVALMDTTKNHVSAQTSVNHQLMAEMQKNKDTRMLNLEQMSALMKGHMDLMRSIAQNMRG